MNGMHSDEQGSRPMFKPTILVADLNLLTLERAKEVLIAAGYNPVLTTTVREVPRLIRELCPAAVIVTIDSDPAGEGWAILHELQDDKKTADTTIIFIVGPQRPLWRFAGYSGVRHVRFLRHPVLPHQLVQVLRHDLRMPGVETSLLLLEQRRVESRSARNEPPETAGDLEKRQRSALDTA
jgi:CheY-like chemotaxis protein